MPYCQVLTDARGSLGTTYTALLNRRRVKSSTGGSNPPLSASLKRNRTRGHRIHSQFPGGFRPRAIAGPEHPSPRLKPAAEIHCISARSHHGDHDGSHSHLSEDQDRKSTRL